ncbi:zf-HC2 domain-containing protein [Candidatus Desantisbacteria bacterium]|nr:zf-HC2 domain-containing protein [Candidatus Desantisbacteria bacterium]
MKMKTCEKIQNYINIYYDNALCEKEKKELFAHIEQCHDCKIFYSELENIEKDLHSLPKLIPPSDFSNKVMQALPQKSPGIGLGEKIHEIFMSPVSLRLNAALITILLFFLALRPNREVVINKTTAIAPETNSTNTMDLSLGSQIVNTKFYLSLPLNTPIQSVSVVGDFNDWNVNTFKLKYKSDGIWEGTFPVRPGKHEYMFVINGEKWIPDPKAREYKEDGFGGKNSILVL